MIDDIAPDPSYIIATQVLAFRAGDLFVVDVDDSYVPKGAPTVIYHKDLPAALHALEDPRLFVHRGQLYLQAFGLFAKSGPPDGRQYLLVLERLPATAGATTAAGPAGPAGGFRVGLPREVLLPAVIPPGLPLGRNSMLDNPRREKNWVAFTHDDTLHMVHSLDPPIVFRLYEDEAGAAPGASIRTEFVSMGGNTSVRWRYGGMRGGTPAIYDSELGGYVTFFHTKAMHHVPTPAGLARVNYYYMGCCVFAAKPPFSIQLISGEPLIGRHFYNNTMANINGSHGIFPQGVLLEAGLTEDQTSAHYVVSYGKDDMAIGAVRFDRRKLIDNLHAPLPGAWKGPPC